MRIVMSRSLLIGALISGLTFTPIGQASTCKPEIRRNNIIANALFTTLFRSINGELHSWRDLGESLGYGASAGYLFYKSREMIGEGRENLGVATAYLASSMTENTTLGEHPLSHLRFGIGPLDLRWATPLARGEHNQLDIGINAIDAISLAATTISGEADDFKIRNGVVTATDRGLIEAPYDGYTINRTVVIREQAQHDDGLWRHELIHTTQYLQFSSFGSLGYNPFDLDRFRNNNLGDGVGMQVRIEWFNTLINKLDQNRAYEDQWMEIEAARLAQDTSPLHDPNDNSCSSQVGFQFQF